MNVYTRVDMPDLASDVECLPATGRARVDETPTASNPAPQSTDPEHSATTKDIPADLASLVNNWNSLPDHIRKTIATLAR